MSRGFIVRPHAPLTIEASQAAAPTAAANLLNDYMGMVWRIPSASSTGWLKVDFGAPVTVDVFALLNMEGAPGTWLVNAAASEAGLASPPFSTSLGDLFSGQRPSSGRANALALLGTPRTYRWWYLEFAGVGGGSGFSAARLVMGAKLQPSRNFEYGAARGARPTGSVEFTRAGAFLRKRGRSLRTLGLNWAMSTRAEAEGAILPLLEQVGEEFVLAVVDPDADARRQARMYFGPLESGRVISQRSYDGFEWQAQIASVI